jgi:hypothetical protein
MTHAPKPDPLPEDLARLVAGLTDKEILDAGGARLARRRRSAHSIARIVAIATRSVEDTAAKKCPSCPYRLDSHCWRGWRDALPLHLIGKLPKHFCLRRQVGRLA